MCLLSVSAMLITDEAGQESQNCSVQIEPVLGEQWNPTTIDEIAYLYFKGQTQLLCRTLFTSFREDTLGALERYLNHIKGFLF